MGTVQILGELSLSQRHYAFDFEFKAKAVLLLICCKHTEAQMGH